MRLQIYPGADAAFDFYYDDGDGYDFENGRFIRCLIRWSEKNRLLTIEEGHTFRPCDFIVAPPAGDRTLRYTGTPLTVAI